MAFSGAEADNRKARRRAFQRKRQRDHRKRERDKAIVLQDTVVPRRVAEHIVDVLVAIGDLTDETASTDEITAAWGKALSRARFSVTRDACGVTAHVSIAACERS
jgi:hypothetical protein